MERHERGSDRHEPRVGPRYWAPANITTTFNSPLRWVGEIWTMHAAHTPGIPELCRPRVGMYVPLFLPPVQYNSVSFSGNLPRTHLVLAAYGATVAPYGAIAVLQTALYPPAEQEPRFVSTPRAPSLLHSSREPKPSTGPAIGLHDG